MSKGYSMSILTGLEEKVQTLVLLSKRLKEEQTVLKEENDSLKKEILSLKSDNAELVDEVIRLEAELKVVQVCLEEETRTLSALHQEKSAAKVAVDDLIKSIDFLVESECSQ